MPKETVSPEVTDNKARVFLKMILPFLRLKRLDANLVLALGKNKLENKKQRISNKDLEYRENLYKLLKLLHHYNE
jgi:hypothetical protein